MGYIEEVNEALAAFPPFWQRVGEYRFTENVLDTLQINIGLKCNLLLSSYRVLTVSIEPFRMRCSYWLGRYVGMCPGAYSDPAKETDGLPPFGAVRGLAGWRSLDRRLPRVSHRRLRARLVSRGLPCTERQGP